MITPPSEAAILWLSDGRQIDLGVRQDVERAMHQILAATGGSSGGGRWSRLFGFSLDLEWDTSEFEALKTEAGDFLGTAEILLGDEAKRLLHRLSAL